MLFGEREKKSFWAPLINSNLIQCEIFQVPIYTIRKTNIFPIWHGSIVPINSNEISIWDFLSSNLIFYSINLWSKYFKLVPIFDGLFLIFNLNVFYFHMPDIIGCLFVILDGHFHPRVTRFEKKKIFNRLLPPTCVQNFQLDFRVWFSSMPMDRLWYHMMFSGHYAWILTRCAPCDDFYRQW